MTVVPWTEWRPDQAELNGDATGSVLNVLCSANSYIPFPDLAALTAALPAKPLGYFTAQSLNGQVTIFAGTATKLYALNNTDLSWTDISQTSVAYHATETARWDFEQFGEYIVAVNVNDDPQVYQLGVSTEFADLAGSPPRAAFVTAWGDFLCLQQLANNTNRVHWSAINDITGWTPGTNNSDYQDFPEGGVIQGSTRATNPLIFLDRAIFVGTFVPGSSVIFTFVKVHDKRGAKSPYSIAARGEVAFFADVGGFYQIGADGAISPIGFEKVDRTIFGRLASSDIATMQGAIDPFYSRVYWTMDLTGAGGFNTLLVYDWVIGRWTMAEQDNAGIFPAASAGYTLEGLDSVSTSIDALPFSLDAKVWQGGAPVLAAFDSSYRLCFFTGDAKKAVITTQEQGDIGGMISLISGLYAVVDTDNYTAAIGSRMKRGAAMTWTGELTPNPVTGRVNKLNSGRFQSIRITVPAGAVWGHAQAVDVDAKPVGRR